MSKVADWVGFIILFIIILFLIIQQIGSIIIINKNNNKCRSSDAIGCKSFTCPNDSSDNNPCNNTPFSTDDGVVAYCQYAPEVPIKIPTGNAST